MTKVITLLGTRPEIIRLSRVIDVLDQSCDHKLVHTGQNYDDRLSGMFFREMGVREPDIYMGVPIWTSTWLTSRMDQEPSGRASTYFDRLQGEPC